jgi:hypothetical protein
LGKKNAAARHHVPRSLISLHNEHSIYSLLTYEQCMGQEGNTFFLHLNSRLLLRVSGILYIQYRQDWNALAPTFYRTDLAELKEGQDTRLLVHQASDSSNLYVISQKKKLLLRFKIHTRNILQLYVVLTK